MLPLATAKEHLAQARLHRRAAREAGNTVDRCKCWMAALAERRAVRALRKAWPRGAR